KLDEEFNINDKFNKMIIDDYENADYEIDDLEQYILEKYKVDVTGKYGDLEIRNPFGKASGQLSSTLKQVETDAQDGLGFVVLKTVISQDELNESEMKEWKVSAPKMVVEKITSEQGEEGYTVTWKGRGWDKSFEDYLKLVKESYKVSEEYNIPVIPSVQYHLPEMHEEFKESEYEYTTKRIEEVWKKSNIKLPFIIEQDFSATLSSMDNSKEQVLRWVKEVPKLVNKYVKTKDFIFGMKLFNPPLGDEFQVQMLEELNKLKPFVNSITAFNRLFDRDKEFEGKKGIAYGGYDLSDRNLRVLDKFNEINVNDVPISATGNVNSGRMMIEYALRGATSGQMHTYFQLPNNNYNLKDGSRTRKALHELMFNPKDGLVPGMLHLKTKFNISEDEVLKFLDIKKLYTIRK
uniref:hypothetical protein n=1 Tax=Clostridium polynesiense TaxID=1325933 RepID=UPI00058E513A